MKEGRLGSRTDDNAPEFTVSVFDPVPDFTPDFA